MRPFAAPGPEIAGRFILAAGFISVACAAVLMLRVYMPCPFWDEWVVIDGIARGGGPHSWSWLWAQQNEHRIVVPRLLIWADVFAFGGKNVSLFAEIAFVQFIHLAALWFIVERFTNMPAFLKRSLEGLFAFCLFHPNQLENFTWAYQISFVLPFALTTLALIAVAFLPHWKPPVAAIAFAAATPLLAAMNLAGGLLIGPVTIAIAVVKRLPAHWICILTGSFLASVAVYLYGYHRSGTDLPLSSELAYARELFVYVLTYFGASWTRLLPHNERIVAFLSVLVFLTILVRSLKKRERGSDFEWFLIAECGFMLATALLTALGRIQFGAGQAFAGRYQTPAMLYWAALGSLLLLSVWRRWPEKIVYMQALTIVAMLASICTFPRIWTANIRLADERSAACGMVMGPRFDAAAAKKLYENVAIVEDARPFLLNVWSGYRQFVHRR